MSRIRSYVRYVDQEFVTEQRSGGFVEQRTFSLPVPYVCFCLAPVGTTRPASSKIVSGSTPQEQSNHE